MNQIKVFLRKVRRLVLMIFSLLIICMCVLMGLLLVRSLGKVEPFLDENGNALIGSISEKTYVKVNDVEQGMFIRGKDTSNPVLLFLHGGPGMPEFFLDEKYPIGLEDYFTVCWWEQRGAGLSYNADVPAEAITVEQLIEDTLQVTKYLCERFGQEKIYLMGHSWGTFVGIQAASQKPELFHAYIGVSQISNLYESEIDAYSYMIEQYKEMENIKMVQKLECYDIFESDSALQYFSSSLRDEAMHKLGIGTMRNMESVITGVFLPVMQCKAYTLHEKINIWKGKSFLKGSTNLHNEMISTDLTNKVVKLEIPVYFISGIYDYTVSYKLTREYFNKLEAPIKGFYSFEESAHSPLFEEKEKFLNIIVNDVLK